MNEIKGHKAKPKWRNRYGNNKVVVLFTGVLIGVLLTSVALMYDKSAYALDLNRRAFEERSFLLRQRTELSNQNEILRNKYENLHKAYPLEPIDKSSTNANWEEERARALSLARYMRKSRILKTEPFANTADKLWVVLKGMRTSDDHVSPFKSKEKALAE
jgi:hypothetical protein